MQPSDSATWGVAELQHEGGDTFMGHQEILGTRPLPPLRMPFRDVIDRVEQCLSFLLMIGLSLVAEGFGFHIPKGYLYAAIGFSIIIEVFNQIARRNFIRRVAIFALDLGVGQAGMDHMRQHE